MTMLPAQRVGSRRTQSHKAAMAELWLPYPPPASKCFTPGFRWSKKQKRKVQVMLKTPRYKAWQQLAVSRTVPPPPHIPGDVSAVIVAQPPTRQARDLDNLLKATFDFLKLRGVIEDDSRICKFSMEWADLDEAGVSVRVWPLRARVVG